MKIKLYLRPCCCCHYSERIILVRSWEHLLPRYRFRCDNCGYESDKRKNPFSAYKRWNQENSTVKFKTSLNPAEECIRANKEDVFRMQRW